MELVYEERKEKIASNKSLYWIFTPLRSVKTSEFNRYTHK